MGFAVRVRSGYFGRGQQVQASTVSSSITAVGQKIALDTNTNPTKIMGSKKFLPCLQELLDRYRLEDPPTEKKLPVEVDVPELLFDMGYGPNETTLGQAVGDLSIIAFYYLLRVGEYTVNALGMNPNKRYSLNWRTSPFLAEMLWVNYDASPGMHRLMCFSQRREPP
jgi:hypothetical protein